jgi:hypothetical protein
VPQKERAWLNQLEGEWDIESEAFLAPDQPLKCIGTERVRRLGGLWIVAEGESEIMGTRVQSMMTLGYDSAKKKYVGTWVDSMSNHITKGPSTSPERC